MEIQRLPTLFIHGEGVIWNPRTKSFETKPIPGGSVGPRTLGRLSPNETQELADLKTTHERLGEVEQNAAKLKDRFGPVEGRFNNLKVKFISDGPTQEVINELNSLITIAYGLSGKQISFNEMKMLQSAMLPRLEQPYENFQATLNFARDWVAKTYENRVGGFKKSGYMMNEYSPLTPQQQAPAAAPGGVVPRSRVNLLQTIYGEPEANNGPDDS